jgi:ParB/RepB/Spo0J family partition protein
MPAATQYVPLARIDCEDTRFQFRVTEPQSALVDSLRQHGQQTPVILMSVPGGFKIIDGFGRIRALRELGRESVLAIVREDLDQMQAFALSFVTNARRRNLSAVDRAHTVWQATQIWGMGKGMVANVLGLSVRQIERYLKILDFDAVLRNALREERITMAHAIALHGSDSVEVPKLIDEIAEKKMSAPELRRQLRQQRPRRRGRRHLMLDAAGFQLRAIRYRHSMSDVEREWIRRELERALELVSAKH